MGAGGVVVAAVLRRGCHKVCIMPLLRLEECVDVVVLHVPPVEAEMKLRTEGDDKRGV